MTQQSIIHSQVEDTLESKGHTCHFIKRQIQLLACKVTNHGLIQLNKPSIDVARDGLVYWRRFLNTILYRVGLNNVEHKYYSVEPPEAA